MSRAKLWGVLALLLTVSACISIESLTSLTLPHAAAGSYRLEIRVESYASEIVAVRAEIDGTAVDMRRGSGSTWRTNVTRPTCSRGFAVRYLVDYRLTEEGPIQTKTEPAAGELFFRISNVPASCPPGTQRELVVNTLGDSVDAVPGDGSCADSAGRCSLRAALMESNALAGPELVRVPAGTITLSLTTGSNRFGIPITDGVTIRGVERASGMAPTSIVTVDRAAGTAAAGFGFPIFRIAETGPRAFSVHIADLTMRGGMGLYGGAISNRAALLVQRSVIEGTPSAAQGGAIWNSSGGTVTVEHSTLRDNRGATGGAIYNAGNTIIRQSTLSGNGSSGLGGALHSYIGQVEIVNSTLSGNVAREGGALSLHYPVLASIRSSTITGNRTTGGTGGGIDIQGRPSILLSHTIVAGNSATPLETSDASGRFASLGHNLLGVCSDESDAACALTGSSSLDLYGSRRSPLDAVLLALADNGGFTRTHLPHESSPAVDSGSTSDSPNDANGLACTQKDQRSVARPQGSACDMGAVER